MYSLGIDFGTTNTVLALAGRDGPAHLVKYAAPNLYSSGDAEGVSGGELFAFRSCLSFHAPHEHPHGPHPHSRSDHHHHPHPHPHLASPDGHHHAY